MANSNIKKAMALILALSMCSGLISVPAMATEITEGTVEVETTAGNKEPVNVTVTIEKTENADGSTTVDTTEEAKNAKTEDGMKVNYESTSSMTTDKNGVTTGEAETDYTSKKGNYTATGGSELTITKGDASDVASNITVHVPLTSKDNPETKDIVENQNTVEKVKSEPKVDGDIKTGPNDGVYDYTTTTTTSQVTATNKEITITETQKWIDEDGNVVENSDLNYAVSQVAPFKGNTEGTGDNDLISWIFRGNRIELPEKGEEIDVKEGYEYKYLGAGNTSQYLPTFLYKTPSPDNPTEEPAYIAADGTKYYIRERNGLNFENVYQNGVESQTDRPYQSIFSVPQQFLLVDATTGDLITTYCADADTGTITGYNYNMENLEDADYYEDEQAAMIRTIATNGYWGTTGTETDEAGNTVPKAGSLNAMKEMMKNAVDKDGNPIFDDTEINSLTDGIALTATQMSIWTFSNEMSDMHFLNAAYSKDGNDKSEVATSWASQLIPSDYTPENKEPGIDLLYKLYNYMINLEPTSYEEDCNTSNTVINADNFLKDMAVTVVEKAKNHDNNKDNDDTNDAYVTDLTFALVVTPSTENGDDLVVKVVGTDGSVLASGRIAGDLKEGEQYVAYDENTGNYSFSGITIIEGDQQFNITLEGMQNLKEGVYLYSSEVVTEKDEEGNVVDETSSQTMVGIASGKHAVDVSMNITFNVSVEDEVVATEHVWRTERTKPSNNTPPVTPEDPPEVPPVDPNEPPVDPDEPIEIPDDSVPEAPVDPDIPEEPIPCAPVDPEIPDENVPTTDIPVEIPDETPLADVPKTGDISALWYGLTFLSGGGLLGLFTGRKGKDEQ